MPRSGHSRLGFLTVSTLLIGAFTLAGCGEAMHPADHHHPDPTPPLPAAYQVSEVPPALETENIDALTGDVDDPAIWVHPTNSAQSLIVVTLKDGGLRVYDLQGNRVQSISPGPLSHDLSGQSRYNNVDIVYGFRAADGSSIDLAVASDRGQDLVRVFQIDGSSIGSPLTDVTSDTPARLFPTRPRQGSEADAMQDESVSVGKQHSAYGIAHFSDVKDGKHYVLLNQRKQARIVQFELLAEPAGKVNVKPVPGRDWRFPYTYKGQSLRQEHDQDASRDWSPQFEGLVVDQRSGILYAGQEDVGLWRIDLRSGKADSSPFYETRGSGREFYAVQASPDGPVMQVKHSFFNPESKITRDVEGLTIYYGPGGTGYLLTSSQGSAHGSDAKVPDAPYDDSFVVFMLDGDKAPRFHGGFRIAGSADGKLDGVQQCDGAEVLALALPGFPYGVLVSQDGFNDDLNNFDDATHQTNLKLTSWEAIASQLGLEKYSQFDPRKP